MKKAAKREGNYRFKAEDFDKIEAQQNYKCYLTGRAYHYHKLKAAPIVPLHKGGKHEFTNICFVIDEVRELKRYHTNEEILEIAFDIIKTIGRQYGYEAKKK